MMALGCRRLAFIFLCGICTWILSPLGVFWLAARDCDWPEVAAAIHPSHTTKNADRSDASLHMLVIADAHVLGRRRSGIDQWWTDWGLASGYRTALSQFHPDIVVDLGDVTDEASFGSFYEEEIGRVRKIFLRGKMSTVYNSKMTTNSKITSGQNSTMHVPYVTIVGNHDAKWGYHYLHDAFVRRFSSVHGFSTGVFKVKNVTFARINSMALHPSAHANQQSQLKEFLSKSNRQIDVLLTHMPLYRKDDLKCGHERDLDPPNGGVTYYSREQTLKEYSDVLSQSDSKKILASLQPHNILSGHLHSACRFVHENKYLEVGVPSFSWRMRPDAGYALAIVSPGSRMRVQYCSLPNEHILLAVLVASAVVASICAIDICLRTFCGKCLHPKQLKGA